MSAVKTFPDYSFVLEQDEDNECIHLFVYDNNLEDDSNIFIEGDLAEAISELFSDEFEDELQGEGYMLEIEDGFARFEDEDTFYEGHMDPVIKLLQDHLKMKFEGYNDV